MVLARTTKLQAVNKALQLVRNRFAERFLIALTQGVPESLGHGAAIRVERSNSASLWGFVLIVAHFCAMCVYSSPAVL